MDKFSTEEKLKLLAELSFEKFARDVIALDVSKFLYLTDYFLIMTVDSQPQMKAMVEHLKIEGRKKGIDVNHIEGEKSLTWILMGYGDIAVHIFLEKERELYDLEGLWFQADKIVFKDEK